MSAILSNIVSKRKTKFISLFSLLFLLQNQGFTQNSAKEIYYDTIKLPEPKPGKDNKASPGDYDHCIDITNGRYTVQLDKKSYTIANESELDSFIRKNRSKMIKMKVSIISDSKTKYSTVINILTLLNDRNISNYKLVSTDGKFTSSNPIAVQSESPFTRDIRLSDSTVFIISIIDSRFETSFLNEKISHTKISELDTYIATKLKNIDGRKIAITAPGNARYEIIEPVMGLLKKYNFLNYDLVPIN